MNEDYYEPTYDTDQEHLVAELLRRQTSVLIETERNNNGSDNTDDN